MIIISLLLISISFAYSPIASFPRIICYESFSEPRLHLLLHTYSYTGPQLIKVNFILKIKYKKSSRLEIYWNKFLYFKKADGFCDNSNITFATNSKNYYQMLVLVLIYLPRSLKTLSFTKYSFEKGFKSDKYILIDEYGNFAISAKITDSQETFPQEIVADENEVNTYLMNLKYEGNHICFVTDNNRQNTIKPFFDDENKEKGYIIGITVKILQDGISEYFEYPAFECDIPEGYDMQTYFIFEGNEEPKFFADTTSITEDDKLIGQTEGFSTDRTSNKLTKKMLYSRNFNLVFLMKQDYIKCNDSTVRLAYKSENNTFLYVHHPLSLQVKPNVNRYQWITYDPFNPC